MPTFRGDIVYPDRVCVCGRVCLGCCNVNEVSMRKKVYRVCVSQTPPCELEFVFTV